MLITSVSILLWLLLVINIRNLSFSIRNLVALISKELTCHRFVAVFFLDAFCMLSRDTILLFVSLSLSPHRRIWYAKRAFGVWKSSCARPSASLSRKRVQEPCLFIRPRVHNALPARVGENSRRNISFGASCSFNQWHLWARQDARRACHTCAIRRYVGVRCAPREKTTRIRDSERRRTPGRKKRRKRMRGMSRSFDYYLLISKPLAMLSRPPRDR